MSMALSGVAAVHEKVTRRPEHRNEILCVQALRGLAVLIVLVVHVEDMANRIPFFSDLHSWYSHHFGYSGPDLFFVISGFIMSYITLGQPFRARTWAMSRFIRIYPMYFLFTLLAFAIFLGRPDQPVMGSGPHTSWSIIQSFLILPQKALPLLFVGWTVQHEVVFYSVVFIVASTIGPRMLFRVLGALSVCALARWIMINPYGLPDWSWNVPSLYLWQFLMGALVYRFRLQAQKLGVWGAAAGATVFLATGTMLADSGLIGGEQPLRVLLFGAGYTLVLITFLNREDRLKARGAFDSTQRSFVVRLGDASYSMYLCHPFVLASFGHVGRWLNITDGVAYAWLPLSFVTVIACGMIIYNYVERPVLATCRQYLVRKPAQEAAR